MTKFALVADTCKSRSAYLETCRLPTFYMEDFSILGILVENYEAACTLLEDDGYTVVDKNGSGDVLVDRVEQIHAIITTLRNHGVAAELSDIADTIYQA